MLQKLLEFSVNILHGSIFYIGLLHPGYIHIPSQCTIPVLYEVGYVIKLMLQVYVLYQICNTVKLA